MTCDTSLTMICGGNAPVSCLFLDPCATPPDGCLTVNAPVECCVDNRGCGCCNPMPGGDISVTVSASIGCEITWGGATATLAQTGPCTWIGNITSNTGDQVIQLTLYCPDGSSSIDDWRLNCFGLVGCEMTGDTSPYPLLGPYTCDPFHVCFFRLIAGGCGCSGSLSFCVDGHAGCDDSSVTVSWHCQDLYNPPTFPWHCYHWYEDPIISPCCPGEDGAYPSAPCDAGHVGDHTTTSCTDYCNETCVYRYAPGTGWENDGQNCGEAYGNTSCPCPEASTIPEPDDPTVCSITTRPCGGGSMRATGPQKKKPCCGKEKERLRQERLKELKKKGQ